LLLLLLLLSAAVAVVAVAVAVAVALIPRCSYLLFFYKPSEFCIIHSQYTMGLYGLCAIYIYIYIYNIMGCKLQEAISY
jgi:hypothetical protein